MEIERKWKIAGFPASLAPIRSAHMRQGYLSVAPVVRIRDEGGRYVLCFKGPGTLAREEIELPLDEETFGRLEALIGRPLVTKEYRAYRLPGGEVLEVSLVDEGQPTEFYYAEVEFPSVEAANAFTPPEGLGLGEEMTQHAGFSMSRYWRYTRGDGALCPYCGAALVPGEVRTKQVLWWDADGTVDSSQRFVFPHPVLSPTVLPAPYCPVCKKVFLARRHPDIGDSIPPVEPEGPWG